MMQLIQGIHQFKAPFSSSVLTIGNFDGVHLGHRALVERLTARAREKNVPAVVLTFEPHPVKVLHPDRKLQRIFDLEDQANQLAKMGVDHLVIEPFSREFSELPPERFLLDWIFKPFVPDSVVVGYDFSFGRDRRGSIDFLKDHGKSLGFLVDVVPPMKVGEVVVSSSRIRQAVENGDMPLAEQLLGRKFYVAGLVEKGAGRGSQIGVATANLRSAAELIPGAGVYAAWVNLLHPQSSERWPAAVNVGYNPTFEQQRGLQPKIEAHLIGFNSILYGEKLKIEFVTRLREERKFASAKELVEQIRRDIEGAKRALK